MNGDNLIVRVREYLRDITSDIVKGEEWDDLHIVTALNAAQHIYVNYCLQNEQYFNLRSLFRSTSFAATATPQPLPADYLHYRSAWIGDTDDALRVAQVYAGGMADVFYYNMKQRAAMIIGSNIQYMRIGQASSGVLNYIKYPSFIGATSLGQSGLTDFDDIDFHAFVYENIIARQAMVILSMREGYTTRDVKGTKRYSIEKSIYQFHDTNYLSSGDMDGSVVESAARQAQQARDSSAGGK